MRRGGIERLSQTAEDKCDSVAGARVKPNAAFSGSLLSGYSAVHRAEEEPKHPPTRGYSALRYYQNKGMSCYWQQYQFPNSEADLSHPNITGHQIITVENPKVLCGLLKADSGSPLTDASQGFSWQNRHRQTDRHSACSFKQNALYSECHSSNGVATALSPGSSQRLLKQDLFEHGYVCGGV